MNPRRHLALVTAMAFALQANRGRAADPADLTQAKAAFSAGVVLLQDPDGAKYEEALSLFRRAHRLSASWKVLGNIALCELKLERDGEAVETYERYLTEGGAEIDATERSQVQRDIAALKAATARVRLSEIPQMAVVTDERIDASGRKVVNTYPAGQGDSVIELGVHPGHHTFTVAAKGFKRSWETVLDAGATTRRSFAADPESASEAALASPMAQAPQSEPPAPPPPAPRAPVIASVQPEPRTLGWVVAGVGVVGLAAGMTSFVVATGKKSVVNDECHDDTRICSQTGQDAVSAIHTLNVVTVSGIAVGAVGLGVGSWLLLKPSSKSSVTAQVSPAVLGSSPGWVVGGTW